MKLQNRILYLRINEVQFEKKLNLKTIKSTTIKEHHIKFSGSRNEKGCTGSITIFNLDFEFNQQNDLNIELWGGYQKPFLIFKGDVISMDVEKNGSDSALTFQAVDGGKLYEAENFNSEISNITLKDAMKGMIEDLKKAGAETADFLLDKVKSVLGTQKTQKAKTRRKIIDGIDKILSGYEKNAKTSIHNNVIDILIDDELGGSILKISSESGLIGSVKKFYNIEKKKKSLSLSCLMMHNFKIGQKIDVIGIYIITSINYSLSNYSSEFYANLEAIQK